MATHLAVGICCCPSRRYGSRYACALFAATATATAAWLGYRGNSERSGVGSVAARVSGDLQQTFFAQPLVSASRAACLRPCSVLARCSTPTSVAACTCTRRPNQTPRPPRHRCDLFHRCRMRWHFFGSVIGCRRWRSSGRRRWRRRRLWARGRERRAAMEIHRGARSCFPREPLIINGRGLCRLRQPTLRILCTT